MSSREFAETEPTISPEPGGAGHWIEWAQARILFLKEEIERVVESRGKVHVDYLKAYGEAALLKKERDELKIQIKSLEGVIANRKGIETLDPGDEVLVDHKVRGKIEAAVIGRGGDISYFVSWWDGLTDQQARFHSSRVSIEPLTQNPGR